MNERQWYYVQDGAEQGPVEEYRLSEKLEKEELGPTTLVWTEPMEQWRPAFETKPFKNLFSTEVLLQVEEPERPRAVTVFGIINIVFGSIGLLCIPVSMMMNREYTEIINPSDGVIGWLLVTKIISFACSFVLLFLGIGLLQLKAWAREWTYYYGWFAISLQIIASIVNLLLILFGEFGYKQEDIPLAIAGTCLGMVLGCIYPTLLVTFMRKPNIIRPCYKD